MQGEGGDIWRAGQEGRLIVLFLTVLRMLFFFATLPSDGDFGRVVFSSFGLFSTGRTFSAFVLLLFVREVDARRSWVFPLPAFCEEAHAVGRRRFKLKLL